MNEVTDAQVIRKVLSDPSLVEFVDSPEMKKGWHYFGDESGLIVFEPVSPGIWEGHMMMLRHGAADAAREASSAMLERGAREIWGFVSHDNRKALRAAMRAGYHYVIRMDNHHFLRFRHG